MFSIFGKSRQAAKKTVDKLMMNDKSDISQELVKMNKASQTEKQALVDKYIDETFSDMKPMRCTHEFSTPKIAIEAFEMMRDDKSNFCDISIMKKVPKLNAEAYAVISKATGKPLMKWIPLHEEHQQAAEAA